MLAMKCQSGGPTVCSGSGMVIDMPSSGFSHICMLVTIDSVFFL